MNVVRPPPHTPVHVTPPAHHQPCAQSPAQKLQDDMLAFPLLFTLFLLLGGCCITLYFYHASRYEVDETEEVRI